ncbi:hypothetical protein J1782_08640 [Rahnella sp. BCC 1045]|uniref:hypothetical protein n=1 Tax=Rahnella sp. BCC 1045 TaxID=2816251 RepID=UPI001C268335|nr:hypothetical protein [Rahnella sp. BCC 1045]MBU9819954.1 hypothetical protein [Rahnella sp. BCC 1045]
MSQIDCSAAEDALEKIKALATAAGFLNNSAEQLDLMLGILEVISQAAAEGLKKHVA